MKCPNCNGENLIIGSKFIACSSCDYTKYLPPKAPEPFNFKYIKIIYWLFWISLFSYFLYKGDLFIPFFSFVLSIHFYLLFTDDEYVEEMNKPIPLFGVYVVKEKSEKND